MRAHNMSGIYIVSTLIVVSAHVCVPPVLSLGPLPLSKRPHQPLLSARYVLVSFTGSPESETMAVIIPIVIVMIMFR